MNLRFSEYGGSSVKGLLVISSMSFLVQNATAFTVGTSVSPSRLHFCRPGTAPKSRTLALPAISKESEAIRTSNHHVDATSSYPSSPSPTLSSILPTQIWANAVASALLLAVVASSSVPDPAGAVVASVDLKNNSPAVNAAITSLREASASPNSRDEIFKSFESIADIITEGKGVGGSINYRGVQLERGYVADEDTTIYNPGLTLLTESEKTQLVQAIVESRASALVRDGAWSDDNQLAYQFLKDKLDPFHITELRGYLATFPALVVVAYAVNLAVQQLARDWFPISYGLGVAVVVLPALALLALDPPS